MILLLKEHGPGIEYVKGPKNIVADALSALPNEGDILEYVAAVTSFVPLYLLSRRIKDTKNIGINPLLEEVR